MSVQRSELYNNRYSNSNHITNNTTSEQTVIAANLATLNHNDAFSTDELDDTHSTTNTATNEQNTINTDIFDLSTNNNNTIQIYRVCSLGKSLVRTLSELVDNQTLTQQAAIDILIKYDRVISYRLHHNIDIKLTGTGELYNYRNCDGLWTLQCSVCNIKHIDSIYSLQTDIMLKNVKIVSCENIESNNTFTPHNHHHKRQKI